MWIKKVTAHAFGPFRGDSLELARGLTVVFGPNESGKSSWHDAVYAALCGMRSRRGRLPAAEQAFKDKRKPWSGDEWRVAAELELSDGRNVEIHHDLEGQIDSWAKDLDVSQEVTSELTVHSASPDGAVWLGLDRDTFLAVASIRQADILGIKGNANSLQEYLQRAAATSGADETAGAAISVIEEFYRENVGLLRSNSTRPHQRAMNRVKQAEQTLVRAHSDHDDWQGRLEDLAGLQAEARSAGEVATAAEVLVAIREAEQIEQRLDTARDLLGRYPEPVSGVEENAALREQVATALHEWRQRPNPSPLTGRTVADLEEDLEGLPATPVGDLECDPTVRTAHRNLLHAREWHEAHLGDDPGFPDSVSEEDAPTNGRSPVAGILAVAAVLLLGGAWLMASGRMPFGLASLAIGMLVAWSAILRSQRADLHHVVAEQVAAVTVRSRQAWEAHADALATARADAAGRLATALELRGTAVDDDVDEIGLESLYSEYETACRQRSQQILAAARRPALEQALSDRRRAEVDYAGAIKRVEQAQIALIAAVEAVGGIPGDGAEMVMFLEEWLEAGRTGMLAADEARTGRAQLEALLAGGTIEDLTKAAARAAKRVDHLGRPDDMLMKRVDLGDDPATTVRSLRRAAEDMTVKVAAAQRELEVREESFLSVADAEEEMEAARRNLDAVETLADVLTTTSRILHEAQERVHRDIAPRLRDGVSDRLAKVTGGRYSEVTINPETLNVQVKDPTGQWRNADQLSHGTAEQIYLLLRVAMAEILTPPSVRCPLLLDDTTVHSDSERTQAILGVLREVSADHQIVLFTQEEDVVRWARDEGLPVVELTRL